MEYFILGSGGRLGSQIYRAYFSMEIVSIPSKTYRSWSNPDQVNEITAFFKKFIDEKHAILFIAGGLIDPSRTKLELNQANYLLPKNILEATQRLNVRVITFGTIMEKYNVSNPYIDSKKKFLDYVEKHKYTGKQLTHIRLHTLYGIGSPSKFMFLGLIFRALKYNLPFSMTNGEQFREYHHILDDITAIDFLVKKKYDRPIIDLSHGNSVRLRDLATYVFGSFQKDHLLHIGELVNSRTEVYSRERKSEALFSSNIKFRDTLKGINKYLNDLLKESA